MIKHVPNTWDTRFSVINDFNKLAVSELHYQPHEATLVVYFVEC